MDINAIDTPQAKGTSLERGQVKDDFCSSIAFTAKLVYMTDHCFGFLSSMKPLLPPFVAHLFALVLALPGTALATPPAASGELHVLFTSDIYGRYAWPRCSGPRPPGRADMSQMVTVVKARQAELKKAGHSAPLVLSVGSMVRPDAMGGHIWGPGHAWASMAAESIQRVGFHAVSVGPYDFGAPAKALERYMGQMRQRGIPLLSANALCEDKGDFRCKHLGSGGRRYRLLQQSGLRVGIFAVNHADTTKRIRKTNRGSLKMQDPVETTKRLVKLLREQEQADLVILLASLNDEGNTPQAVVDFVRKLGDAAPDLVVSNVMYDRDTGDFIRTVTSQRGPPIVGTDRFGQHLGEAVIRFRRGAAGVKVDRVDMDLLDLSGEPADLRTDRLGQDMLRELCRALNQPLGQARAVKAMSLQDFKAYTMEVMRNKLSAEVALINDSALADTSFPIKGAITRETIVRSIRSESALGYFRMTGATMIKKIGLPYVVKKKPGLNVLGITKKGKKWYINSRLIRTSHHYKVATTSFVAGGGDGLISLYTERFTAAEPTLRRVLLDHFEDGGSALVDGDPDVDLAKDFSDPWDRWLIYSGLNAGLSVSTVSVANGGSNSPYNKPLLKRDDQTALKVTAEVSLGASNRYHRLDADLGVKYGHTWADDASAESADQIRLDLSYMLTRFQNRDVPSLWYMPVPYADITLTTEFSGDSTYCPAGVDKDATSGCVGEGAKESYHYLDMGGTAGVGLLPHPSLFLKTGFAVNGELLTPDQALQEQGFERAGQVGLFLGYKLRRFKVNSSVRSPILLESRLDFFLTDLSDSLRREMTWETKVFFNFLPMFYISASYRLYYFEADTDRGSSASVANDISLGFEILTDYRHQLF